MAGIMDEYDPATPVSKTYCARLTTDQYEKQASSCTADSLAELIDYLEANPGSYRRVLAKRRKEEEESAGFFSFAKVSLSKDEDVWIMPCRVSQTLASLSGKGSSNGYKFLQYNTQHCISSLNLCSSIIGLVLKSLLQVRALKSLKYRACPIMLA